MATGQSVVEDRLLYVSVGREFAPVAQTTGINLGIGYEQMFSPLFGFGVEWQSFSGRLRNSFVQRNDLQGLNYSRIRGSLFLRAPWTPESRSHIGVGTGLALTSGYLNPVRYEFTGVSYLRNESELSFSKMQFQVDLTLDFPLGERFVLGGESQTGWMLGRDYPSRWRFFRIPDSQSITGNDRGRFRVSALFRIFVGYRL